MANHDVLSTSRLLMLMLRGKRTTSHHPFTRLDQSQTGKRKLITPWGRYRYKTAPQGHIASGDGYTRRYHEFVSDIPNKTKCVDDVLLWADSLADCFFQAVQWLDTCGRNGITLNPDKFVFGEDTVEFAGFEITPDSVRPCRKNLQAILDFPTPKDITDVRSWFGFVNQVSYAFSMAEKMLPFRQLLKPSSSFKWDENLQNAFEESKAVIASEIEEGVQIFDPSKPLNHAMPQWRAKPLQSLMP
ncbi:uncharacterized protein LOC119732286 [Patiria miniata]|uniref:Uncharacterized protein n=1 Tax=Patiria miniata TaxID=46514 RepID=A0A914AE87_PATMI|nr:uncharacterized protein LOC119732286 [Patiria miniata]